MSTIESDYETPLSDPWIRRRWGDHLTDQDCETKRNELARFADALLHMVMELKCKPSSIAA
jgi:hypothetical protein